MSALETVLNRAMSDPAFAEALFADPEKVLAEYELPAEVIAEFKNISRAEFDALETEERQSMMIRGGKQTTYTPIAPPTSLVKIA